MTLARGGRSRSIELVFGKSLGGVYLGMRRKSVEALGYTLVPDGVQRSGRFGFISGPLHFLFNEAAEIVLISLSLRKSAGLRYGTVTISPHASLDELATKFPGCTLSDGSGGRTLRCVDAAGNAMDAYDERDGNQVWVHLGPG